MSIIAAAPLARRARRARLRPQPAATLLLGLSAVLSFTALPPRSAAAPPAPAPAAAVSSTESASSTRPDSVPGALAEARRLFAQRRHEDALSAIDAGLRRTPGDAQLRFQKGVILADLGRSEQALELFKALTEEFPELPEPYNNVATLYAARGQLDQAREALETALRALPSYALASENLGDIYLRLAERAWQHAAEVEPGNAALRNKLTLARELIARVSPSGSRPSVTGTPAAGTPATGTPAAAGSAGRPAGGR